MIKKAEDDSLNRLGFAEETADKFIAKAFFKLCEGQKPGKSGEIPILVYNPLPYKVEREIEVEFQLEDQNWTRDETTIAHVKNSSGEFIFSQNEKEDCTFFLDWRKKIAFRAVLEPMSVNRFDCELECIKNYKKIADYDFDENYIIFDNEHLSVRINRKTGLIDKYAVDGKDMLNKGSGAINVYNDDEAPWGMRVDGFYDKCASFSLMSDADANEYNGYPDETKENVRVIENGEVRTKVQAIFEYRRSVAIVTYTIPKHDTYVDIDIKMLTNDVNKLFKLSFDTTIEENVFLGQTAFGTDKLLKEEKEVTFQKWCGFENKDKRFYVINNGTYGGSADKNILNITLLRTPVYSAHPIIEQIAPTDRNHEHIDIGERNFKYRITSEKNIDCEAESFNLPPYALSFFPSGKEGSGCDTFELDNKEILLSTFQKCDDKIIFRLYNSQNRKNTAGFKILGDSYTKEFNPFEVKTFVADSSDLKETDMLGE